MTTIITDVTIPTDRFELGRAFREFPEVEVELERIVPLREATFPLCWVSGAERDAVEATLRDHVRIRTVNVLASEDDETLFEVEWDSELDGLVRALVDARAVVLEASGNAETWDFRLRFRSHEHLTAFSQALTDDGVPVTLRHLYNPTIPDDPPPLSDEQREALVRAYHRGYFEVPRCTPLSEIAAGMGISDSALSQRLRRGTATLVERTLVSGDVVD